MHRLFLIATLCFARAGLAASLDIFPPEVSIGPKSDQQRVIVSFTDDDGFTHDVTDAAQASLADAGIADWRDGALHAVKTGATKLSVQHAGLTASAAVKVQAQAAPKVSFQNEVEPVLMRYGCNTGGCHGASRGKEGFRLSLFGYDPEADHFRLTREFLNRRINLAVPEESLLLLKGSNTLPHGGGKKLLPDDPNYALLLRWIREGADADEPAAPVISAVSVHPSELTLDAKGQTHAITVLAAMSDGTQRDVTHLSVLESSDKSVASVTADGQIASHQRGEAFISVRLPAFITGVRVDVVPRLATPLAASPQGHNYIDEHVYARLQKLRITPAGLTDDRAFIRRVFIDTIGLLPTPEEVSAFLADMHPDKRARLIDALLKREEFTDLWTMKWMERLQARSIVSASAALQKATINFNTWMRRQLADRVPMNQIFRTMIASRGTWMEQPETNFFRERDGKVLMENMSQLFLGARLQCAQCHNHPFDRWTQNDYYGMAAFFAQVGKKTVEDPQDMFIYENASGEMLHPVSNVVMKPKFLGGAAPATQATERRKVLADWLTSPDNTLVARNLANIYWQHFFGTGIIDPVDDVRVSNPPSNPALLDALAAHLTTANFDFRVLIRDILNSRTYQHASTPNDTNRADHRNFSRCYPRRPRAEVLWDCITQVTGHRPNFYLELPGTRAVQLFDGGLTNDFLNLFGRTRRETPCTCDIKNAPTLTQALHLINGDTVTTTIRNGDRLHQWLPRFQNDMSQVLDHLSLTTLSRLPTTAEKTAFTELLKTHPSGRDAAFEDIFWTLLNSSEFLFNH
ncbi:MAG: DUF1549 domain-containing protein [Chthoniobacteraceae bacterium]